ncbi:MAG TPA: 2-succinyl-5-enolpyruvyl-6-hydroxy-3-cyclohexene-1-carboxylic-acid synthase, partial [Ignavibacteriaceae bacterium]
MDNFFDRLSGLGVRYVCISPGSRSTALTLSASAHKKLSCFVNTDERNSAFFALGLAGSSGKPVVIITTSGTAAAELYPAIIEAYQQRIGLIVCTADRPPELIGRGTNQTINQDNIYKNHIRFYKNAGLPEISVSAITRVRKLAEESFYTSTQGPVHINFPFRKPFEPHSYTDEINNQTLKLLEKLKSDETLIQVKDEKLSKGLYNKILSSIIKAERGLVLAGPMKYDINTKMAIVRFAERLGYPIVADACSQLRFGTQSNNVISNYEGYLGNSAFIKSHNPDLIIQFGRTPSSKAIDIYIDNTGTSRYIINEYRDLFDPWNSASGVLKCSPSLFSQMILQDTRLAERYNNRDWLNQFILADNLSRKIQDKIVNRTAFPNECRIIPEVMSELSDNTHIMISNSMPVRDLDYFLHPTGKKLIIHSNRGASGIDGIVSTALGIQRAVNRPTILITGDLAFY